MPAFVRLGVSVLLIMLLPFQALTATYLDLGGPAHFHIDSGAEAHHHDEPHDHGHDHRHREHHHHASDDPTVVGVDEDAGDDSEAGWSSTLCAAMLIACLVHALPRLKAALAGSSDARLRPRFLDTPDRPPALLAR